MANSENGSAEATEGAAAETIHNQCDRAGL